MANNCSMCGGNNQVPNYAKQVDPYPQSYGGMFGDSSSGNGRGRKGGNMQTIQVCLPTVIGPPAQSPGQHMPGQQPSIINVPTDSGTECPKIMCEPCPPPPPTKVWLIKSSPIPQKSACLPLGNSDQGNSTQPTKIMICLPCPAPNSSSGPAVSNIPQVPATSGTYRGKETFAFAVPYPIEGECARGKPPGGGKYLPPPEKKICSKNCIHVSDIKGERPCTWHQKVPCLAHCFNTPL